MVKLFKVWSLDRIKKCIVPVDTEDPEKMYTTLIINASKKMQINGSIIVLESDGTPVDEDVLPHLDLSNVLLLLQPNEVWGPLNVPSDLLSPTLSSTVTNRSSHDNSVLSDTLIEEPLPSISQTTSEHELENSKKIEVIYTINCNKEFIWENFSIPWEKLSQYVINELEQGRRDKRTITEVIHTVVNELRTISNYIPSKAVKLVAKKLIDKYPTSFRDIDEDGVVLGDGSHSIFSKIQDRINYLNRPHNKRKIDISDDNVNPVLNKKANLSRKAGCQNWAPADTICCSADMLQSAKNMTSTDEDFINLLENSYAEQRKFINQSPSILEIQKEWPILFSTKAIFWHFNKLTNSNINALDTFHEKENKILSLAKTKKIEIKNDLTMSVEEKLLHIISTHFKEELSFFIKVKEINDLDVENIPNHPTLVKNESDNTYYIYVEKTRTNIEGYNTFTEAFKVTFAFFFNFNLEYPRHCSTTLEFIQRYVLKIHPDVGSKTKKINSIKKKVINLMNLLAKF